MPIYMKSSGNARNAVAISARVGGEWRNCTSVHAKVLGEWKLVFPDGGTPPPVGGSLFVYFSPWDYADGTALGNAPKTVFSSDVTVLASGGVGPYTYLWEYVSGSMFPQIYPSATSQTVHWRYYSVHNFFYVSSVWKVTITDAVLNTVEGQVLIDLFGEP